MKTQIRDYRPEDLSALCALVAAADSCDQAARALAPKPARGMPLFLFAPRYPLGLERGITPLELRNRLGATLERIGQHVLVAIDRDGRLVACVVVVRVEDSGDQAWRIEPVIAPACRTEELGHVLLVTAVEQVHRLASEDGLPSRPHIESRALVADADSWAHLQSVGLVAVRTFAILDRDVEEKEADPRASAEALPGIQIRSYRPEDGPAWVATFNAAFAEHWGNLSYTLETWTRHVRSPRFEPSLSLVAAAGQSIVGLCHITPSLVAGEEHRAHLHILGTHPDYRRRGLGRLLLTKGLCRLRRRAFCQVELDVDSKNVAAMRLYHQMGFRQREAIGIFRTHT